MAVSSEKVQLFSYCGKGKVRLVPEGKYMSSGKLIVKVRGSKINNSGFQGQGSGGSEVWETSAHSILLPAV